MAPKILVLGMPRTGTQSIGEALGSLGYEKAYHMTTVGPNDHHDKWVAALEAKFEGKGPAFGRKEFDELFQGYDIVSDVPASIFYEELMTAYPAAQLVLTTRSEDAWVESMSKTLHLAYVEARAEPSRLAHLYHEHLWAHDFVAHGRAAFRAHNAGVLRAAAARGRPVLVFDPAQGWEALCGFLGKPVPAGVAYPRKDMWVGYKQMVRDVEAGRLTKDAIAVGSLRVTGGEGIRSAYIYTQGKEEDGVHPRATNGEGIKSAYIYTQGKENDGPRPGDGEAGKVWSTYRRAGQTDSSALLPAASGEGIKSAYIYTQGKENDGPRVDGEGAVMWSAYIYTRQTDNAVLPAPSYGEGIKSAYIYTQ